MTSNKLPTLEELIRSNPKVDPDLVAAARAKIEELRKNGFMSEGYRLTGRRHLLVEKQATQTGKHRLPRRHT